MHFLPQNTTYPHLTDKFSLTLIKLQAIYTGNCIKINRKDKGKDKEKSKQKCAINKSH